MPRFEGDGKRVSRSRNGAATTYTWDASGGLALLLWDGATSFLYRPDGKPIEQISSAGVATFLHTDDRGNVRSLTDKAGATVATFSWDAYGNATGRTGTVTTPFGYAGEFRDRDTGLIHLRAREYDPATGQFLTRDPLESETGEPYLYGSGDPVNRADPTGLMATPDIWGVDAITETVVGIGDGASEIAAGTAEMAIRGVSQGRVNVNVPKTREIRDLLGTGGVVDTCSGWYGLGAGSGSGLAQVIGPKGAGTANVVLRNTRYVHAEQRMIERQITAKMITPAIRRGDRCYDRVNGSISHVLPGGCASGKTLLVADTRGQNSYTP